MDLVDQQTGELKEPLLRAKVGQLIQIQCKRDDGWSYGFVIFDTTAAQSDDVPLVSALRDIDKRKAAANGTINDHNPVTTQQQGDGLVSGISGWWKDRRGQRQDPQNAAKNRNQKCNRSEHKSTAQNKLQKIAKVIRDDFANPP